MEKFDKNQNYLFVLNGGGGDLHQIGLTIISGDKAKDFLDEFKYRNDLKKVIKLSDEVKLKDLFNC